MELGKAYKLVSLIGILLIAASVEAKIYKCTDVNGKIKLQDRECSSTEQAEEFIPKKLKDKLSVVAGRGSKGLQFEKNRIQNAHFDQGLEFWKSEFNTQAFGWTNFDGHKSNGATVVQSVPPGNAQKQRLYEVTLSQCVKLDQGRRYRFAASFKAMGEYKSSHANRANLYWYQTEDCSSQGQFADYLEPEPNILRWQRIIHEDELRSLNAKAALIKIVQSRTAGNNQQALWDDIELSPTEMEVSTNTNLNVTDQHTLPIGQNYIENGDFKFNLKPWHHSGDTRWTSSEGANAPGAVRIAIYSDKGGLGAHNISQCINIGANKLFRAGAKAKVDPKSTQQGGGIFRLSWYEDVDCQGRSQAGFKDDRVKNIDGWQELSIDGLEVPPGAQSANVHITRGVNDSGLFAYFIDDVFFEAVTDKVKK